MHKVNRPGAAKSRRGPGRRSRLGWGPLLCRTGRYLKVSTGGAAGKGFTEEILNNFPCGEPGGVAPFLILEGFGAAERVGEKIRSLVLWKVRGTLPVRVLVSGHGIYGSLAEKSAKTVFF